MLAIVFSLSVGVVISQTTNDTCANATCTVSDPITVDSLNAEQLTVGCARVCGGSGSLTELNQYSSSLGACVTQTLFNACEQNTDCTQFRPSPATCYTSTCDTTKGLCQHTATPGCCTSDDQCPERECFTRQCMCPSSGQALMKRAANGELQFQQLATGDCAQQQCQYTPIDNCCLSSFDDSTSNAFACNNMNVCGAHQTAVCDRSGKCQCLLPIDIECTDDADCNPNSNSTTTTTTTTNGTVFDEGSEEFSEDEFIGRKRSADRSHDDDDDDEGCGDGGCRPKPRPHDRCRRLKCSRARICVPDEGEFDNDGDGIPCRYDCNDNDATVGHFIFCARAGNARNPIAYNLDNDSCIDCGAPVDRVCAAACPTMLNETLHSRNGTNTTVSIALFQVNESSLCETPRHADERWFGDEHGERDLHVCFDCDCCHNNTGGCDVPSTCGINNDNDLFPLCGTVHPACVLQQPRNHSRDDEQTEFSFSRSRSRSRSHSDSRHEWDRKRSQHRFEEESDDDNSNFDYLDFEEDTNGNNTVNATELADEACAAWAESVGLDNAAQFVFIPAVEVGNCENCEAISGVKELDNNVCYLDTDRDKHVQCPFSSDFPSCCTFILGKRNDSTFHIEPTVLDCCLHPNANNTGCANSGDRAPIITDTCNCTEPYIPPPGGHVDDCPLNHAGFVTVICFADRDGDGAGDCDCPIEICSRIDNDPAKACRDDKSAGFALVFIDLSTTNKFNNSQCDCDDQNCHERQWVTCLPDHDRDHHAACACDLKCGHCGADEIAFDFSSTSNTKRSLAAAARVFNNHHDFHDERRGHRDHSDSDDDDDDHSRDKSHHGDENCPPPLTNPPAQQACPANETAASIQTLIRKKNATFTCDCCDEDNKAYPMSQFASASPVNCPINNMTLFASNDYNCNGVNGLVAACGSDDVTRVNGKIYRTIGSPDVFSSGFNDTSFLGSCTLNATSHNCTLTPGFTPEAKDPYNEKLQKKRNTHDGVEHGDITVECHGQTVVPIRVGDNQTALLDQLAIGECADFVSGCTEVNGQCYQDCDVCVLIAH
jgi:hypothetical protein